MTPDALDLSIMIRNNIDNKGSAPFSAMITGARRFFSVERCGDAGAEAVRDGGADGVVASFSRASAASDFGSCLLRG